MLVLASHKGSQGKVGGSGGGFEGEIIEQTGKRRNASASPHLRGFMARAARDLREVRQCEACGGALKSGRTNRFWDDMIALEAWQSDFALRHSTQRQMSSVGRI
jgi:hypothetical protein